MACSIPRPKPQTLKRKPAPLNQGIGAMQRRGESVRRVHTRVRMCAPLWFLFHILQGIVAMQRREEGVRRVLQERTRTLGLSPYPPGRLPRRLT